MLRIAVLGCGRIGQMHAANVARHPRAKLVAVYDVNREAAERVAKAQSVTAAASAEEIFSSANVDAVLIATATPTHADYIELAVASGKAAICEKPIDLNLARVNACAAKIKGTKVPIQLAFNRRYDPGHSAARAAMARHLRTPLALVLRKHHHISVDRGFAARVCRGHRQPRR